MTSSQQRSATQSCSQFRLMVSGSAALPSSVFEEWARVSGHRLLERYGMTEIGMALGNPIDGPRIPGTVGYPFPGVSARIVNEKGNDVTCLQKSGELQIKGPNVFSGYIVLFFQRISNSFAAKVLETTGCYSRDVHTRPRAMVQDWRHCD